MLYEGLLGRVVAYFEHGILFLEDPESESVHAEWNSEDGVAHVLTDSVALQVQNGVDGPVDIAIYEGSVEGLEMAGLSRVADVTLESMDERLRLHDPNDYVSLVVQSAESDSLRVQIFVDDEEFVGRVIVLLG